MRKQPCAACDMAKIQSIKRCDFGNFRYLLELVVEHIQHTKKPIRGAISNRPNIKTNLSRIILMKNSILATDARKFKLTQTMANLIASSSISIASFLVKPSK